VADQYRDWPYPTWSRVTAVAPTTIAQLVEEMDGGRTSSLPVAGKVLVAGCGTGREAAINALRFPDANITAIDISEASLAYATERCRALGLDRIDFRLLDLHLVDELGETFDYVTASGVLHHLPDPETGWAKLAGVLRPGGVMQVMVYSKIARLNVRAAQSFIADLRDRPVDDDLLREVRRRLIDKGRRLIAGSGDFYTLAGIHDLLLHRHEDPFDVPRIVRALDSLGLELLAFDLPTPFERARYRRQNPNDPAFRDAIAWGTLEKSQPSLFSGMYKFWCRKPAR
jgi:SAM-dependent methyltransferase